VRPGRTPLSPPVPDPAPLYRVRVELVPVTLMHAAIPGAPTVILEGVARFGLTAETDDVVISYADPSMVLPDDSPPAHRIEWQPQRGRALTFEVSVR
jgi:hypothetical protein